MKTPTEFYKKYVGKSIDFDNYAGVQCVDAFRVWGQWADVPVGATPTNWAEGYWTCRYQLGYEKYFYFITDKNAVRNGDWCIWLKGSSCSLSHIAMYYNGQYFGERQDGNLFFCLATLKNDWAGALRWKGWDHMYVGSGQVIYDQYAGQYIVVRGFHDNRKVTLITAKEDGVVTGYATQLIKDIDDSEHIYYTKLNANFFDNTAGSKTFGEGYGVRCGVNEWSIPQQGAFIFYALHNNGDTEVGMDTDFQYYDRSDIQFACSPALVLMHNGQDCEYVSPAVSWRRNYSTTQSILIRTKDRFVTAISKGNLTPDQVRAWAKSITGIQDLCFMDAGGSTCMEIDYETVYGTSEHRKISTAIAEYVDKDNAINPPDVSLPDTDVPVIETPTDTPSIPVIDVGHEEEETDMEDKKTIAGQLAKLIDVKSIITLSLTLAFVRLALNGTIDQQQMMTIYTVIIGFYFGTQAVKK